MAPDNSWRPGRETSSYKQMLLLLEVEMFYPQSAPFSQAKTIPPRGPDPATEEQKRPSSLCSRDRLQFQARTAQWGEGMVM